MVLIVTPKAADANGYVSVDGADTFLDRRLYTTEWDNAGTTPDAVGYLANGGASAGASTVAVDTGSGTFTSGSKVTFAGHSTEYTVQATLTGDGTLSISPVLTDNVAGGEAVTRQSANQKEKALIWATTIFDNMMVWYGAPTTTGQRLRWPRIGVVDVDGESYDENTIPELLEIATADYALILLQRDKLGLPSILGQGISEASLGPMKVKVDDSQQEDAIPQNILSLLSPLGRLEPEAQVGGAVLPLRRM